MFWLLIQHVGVIVLLMVVVSATCRLVQPRPAVQHLLWLAILVKLLLPPALMWPWSVSGLVNHRAAPVQAAGAEAFDAAAVGERLPGDLAGVSWLAVDLPHQRRASDAGARHPSRSQWRAWLPGAAWIAGSAWLCGACVVLTQCLLRIHRVQLTIRRSMAAPVWLRAEVEELAGLMGVRAPGVVISSGTGTPFVWCLPAPVIVWPISLLEEGDNLRRRGVLIHELAHLRRRDHWATWLELLAKAIWWWNPCQWYVRRRLRESADLACDCWVVDMHASGRSEYANTLIDLCQNETTRPTPALALGIRPRSHRNFERRLEMIMSKQRLARSTFWGWLLAGTLLLLAVPGIAWEDTEKASANSGEAPAEPVASDKPQRATQPAASPVVAGASLDAGALKDMLNDILERIESSYVEQVDEAELAEAAINAMLEKLDDRSTLLSREQMEDLTFSLKETVGVGIALQLEEGQVRVTRVLPDSPASGTAIRPDQIIAEVDGSRLDEYAEGIRLRTAMRKLRGKAGTAVTIGVREAGSQDVQEVRVVRDTIKINPVHGLGANLVADEEHKIGYFRIPSFSKHTVRDVTQAVHDLKGQGMRALVVDLRDCPGGLLAAAVSVSDLFVDSGTILIVSSRTEGERRFDAHSAGTEAELPMVVLVNRHTASAAEILAACLQDHHRATIVGERTYGRGTVQSILPLKSGAGLRLTTARFLRPTGKSLQKPSGNGKSGGVAPNDGFEVVLTEDEQQQLARAIQQRSGLVDNDAAPAAFADRQLERALQHLRTKLEG